MASDPYRERIRAYRTGPFEFDVRSGELRKHGIRIRLQEQPTRILEMLLTRPGDVILREEIQQRLWGDSTVGFDHGINAAVRRLRTALGDSAETPKYIETCARRGYRFVASVEIDKERTKESPAVHSDEEDAVATPLGNSRPSRLRSILVWGMVVVASSLVYLNLNQHYGTPSSVVFPPSGTRFGNAFAISADGQQLAAPVVDSRGISKLWIRSLAGGGRLIDGTEGAASPFWSADGQWVAFFARHLLHIVSASGGPSQQMYAALGSSGGAWNAQGIMLFGPDRAGPLYQFHPRVDSPAPVTHLEEGEALGHTTPQFLEDGRHFVFLAPDADPAHSTVFLGSLDSPSRQPLLKGVSQIGYVPDYLLYTRDGRLLCQRFDIEKAQLAGREQVVSIGNVVAFSASRGGLVYRTLSERSLDRLVLHAADGRVLKFIGEPGKYAEVSVAPDGKQVALNMQRNRSWELWVLSLETGRMRQIASSPTESVLDGVWSPDGKRLAYQFYGRRKTRMAISNLADGSATLLLDDGESNFPDAWSPDGNWILGRRTGGTVILMSADGKSRPQVLLDAPYLIDQIQFSRNGRWVVYNSDESGRWEIYAARFPQMDQVRRISQSGGCQPIWSKDGERLFYLGLDGNLMSIQIASGSVVPVGAPRTLFQSRIKMSCSIAQYAMVSKTGEFLAIEPMTDANSPDSGSPIHVLANWTERIQETNK